MGAVERLEELLAERATQGLPAAERGEIEGLLDRHPEVDPDGFDLAAAAIDLALTGRVEPMPAHLRSAVLERARGVAEIPAAARPLAPVADLDAARAARRPRPIETPSRLPWLAAAAALLVAAIGWWPRLQGPAPTPAGPVATTPPIESVERAEDALKLAWSGTEDPVVGTVGGEVVWSGSEQRGFMRIRGLAANDPSREQYQLWIFDRTRDERYPVDGGVFDIPAGSEEALVPIDAKIEVEEPYLFAVTVEKPGGVVVSSRERIVLLAQA